MAEKFSARIASWVKEVEGAAEAIFLGSVDDLLEDWQRNMKVVTGFNRGSLTVGVNDEPEAIEELRDSKAYQAEYGDAELGDTIKARRTAVYAMREEFGFTGEDSLGRTYAQEGSGSMRRAVQKWPDIVKANEAALGSKIGR